MLLCLSLLLLGCEARGALTLDLSRVPTARFIELDIFTAATAGEEEQLCQGLAAGTIDHDDPRLQRERRLTFHVDETAPRIGRLPAGRNLFSVLVRALEPRCAAVGTACEIHQLAEGDSVDVALEVAPLPGAWVCPPELACDDGACRACVENSDCDDADGCSVDRCQAGQCQHELIDDCISCTSAENCVDDDPCTEDRCLDGVCSNVTDPEIDTDEDGFVAAQCGGDDCDDENGAVNPAAARRCGFALDHDCDGTIDDQQGCGSCEPTEGLTVTDLGTLPTDASQGFFVVGSHNADDPRTLYALAPTALTIATVAGDGSFDLIATVTHGANDPLPPLLFGEHLILVEHAPPYRAFLFSREALHNGEVGEPVVVEEPRWGRPSVAMVVGGRLAISTRPASLWLVELDQLPVLVAPESAAMSGSSYWGDCTAMVRVGQQLVGLEPLIDQSLLSLVSLESSGALRPLRQYFLDASQPFEVSGLPRDDGTSDIAVSNRERGALFIDHEALQLDPTAWTGELQDEFGELRLPDASCRDTNSCDHVTRMAPIGTTGVALLSRDDPTPSEATLRLTIATRDGELRTLHSNDVSLPQTFPGAGETLVVSGDFIFVASTPRGSAAGVRLFRLSCSGG